MWKSDGEIIVWRPHDGEIHYYLYDDVTATARVVDRGVLTENGHMSYSRERRWLLSDTYPAKTIN